MKKRPEPPHSPQKKRPEPATSPPGTREITLRRRRQILDAAEALFAQHGFSGTTTRELANEAGVHEAVLYRHFGSKAGLYRATLEEKLARNRQTALDQMRKCAARRDDEGFFEALAQGLLTRFENDWSITRLILYSALEQYEGPEVVIERQLRVEQPTLDYISLRIREGAFRRIDPTHAVVAFGAMLFGYVIRQQIVGMSSHKKYSPDTVARSFVTIFLEGMRAGPVRRKTTSSGKRN
ncbi:MAG TPA: TetR/AcrR family transcriptional regulator [Terriglobia bacterium]|nr:TetR/AcrR family transcriptional regulator [Terriglobia bacterium]